MHILHSQGRMSEKDWNDPECTVWFLTEYLQYFLDFQFIIFEISLISYVPWTITDSSEVISFYHVLYCSFLCSYFSKFPKFRFSKKACISRILWIYEFMYFYLHLNAMFWRMEDHYMGSLYLLKPEMGSYTLRLLLSSIFLY